MTCVALRITSAAAPGTASSSSSGDEPELHVDLEAGGAHRVEPALGELLGDEDALRHGRRP